MRITPFALTTLVAVATSALPTDKLPTASSSSIYDVGERGVALPSTILDKRFSWFEPNVPCLLCLSECMTIVNFGNWVYGPGGYMAGTSITAFSTCGMRCINRGVCFDSQGWTLSYGSLPTEQRDSEPAQMLISMGNNGLIDFSQ